MRTLSSGGAVDQAQARGRYHAPPPAPPHQTVTSFHQQGCNPLIGSAKAGRHVFTSFCFSKLNFKIQSLLRSILMRCDFPPSLCWMKAWVYFIWKGRVRCYDTVHLSVTHTYTTHGIWPRSGFYLTFTVPEVRL